jgi:hypothetical protein
MGPKRSTPSNDWRDQKPRQDFFDPFSGSAGVDRDFDDLPEDERTITERLRDRGHF